MTTPVAAGCTRTARAAVVPAAAWKVEPVTRAPVAPITSTPHRFSPISVNRQPAVGYYVWREEESAHVPLALDVLRISDGSITEVTIFGPEQFPHLGLPTQLDGGAR